MKAHAEQNQWCRATLKLVLSVATTLLLLPTGSSAAPDPNFYICLCFGQSNMESGGRTEEMDRTVDERFVVTADFDAPSRGWTKGNWYQAVPPLTAQGTGICLVDYSGRTMVANLPANVRVGVIKRAERRPELAADSRRTETPVMVPTRHALETAANRRTARALCGNSWLVKTERSNILRFETLFQRNNSI
jgi:hypothetical protein